MAVKLGDYEIIVKKGDKELETLPSDLPVFDFEGNQITMKEAQEGYMRTADYTKKTQSVAHVRKFLTEQLGFQDDRQGVAVMQRVLDTLSDFEERGLYDSKTGQIKIPDSKGSSKAPTGGGDDDFTIGIEHLPQEVRNQLKQFEMMQKDMGSLMGYLTRKEIRETYPDFVEDEVEMAIKLAAIDPSKTPMEHATAYTTKKKEWGQKAVDAYVENAKKPKDEGHARTGSGEPAIEIFGEDPVFSYDPGAHQGKNVIPPSVAANKYLEAVFDKMRGKD